MRTHYWKEFNASEHLCPSISQTDFDQMKRWDLGWLLLEPLNIAQDDKQEVELSKRFSPGQKALYFFWFIESQVSNGGFIQFYWYGYDQYLPVIIEGLELVKDTDMLALIAEAEETVMKHKKRLMDFYDALDFASAYEAMPEFIGLNKRFMALHDATMDKIEAFARKHPEQFARLA